MHVESDQTGFFCRESARAGAAYAADGAAGQSIRARSIARVIFFIKVLEPKKVLLSGENDWMVTSPVDSIKIKQEKSLKF